MNIFFIFMLLFNCLIGLVIYVVLYRRRNVCSDRFGMIISMSCSGILSLTIAMLTQFIAPLNLTVITLITIVIGGMIGLLFGSLVKFHSLLAGFSHGVIGSVMGAMLGAVIQNPSLCSLPSTYLKGVEHNMVVFSIFGTSLVMITISLVYYSLRV